MKSFLFSLTFVLSLTGCRKPLVEQFPSEPRDARVELIGVAHVYGRVTLSQSYCEGRAPSDEEYYEFIRPKPYAGCVLLFKPGNSNDPNVKASRVITDEKGRFSAHLSNNGPYCVMRAYQADRSVLDQYAALKSSDIQVDMECLENKWKSCILTVNMHYGDNDSLLFHFEERCFLPEGIPCLQYTGPYPP